MKSKLLKVVLIAFVIIIGLVLSTAAYVYYVLPDAGKPPELSIEKTEKRITRGKYLANHVTGCMACHSKRDFRYFAGPVDSASFGAGGDLFGREIGFPGNVYSTNITPAGLKNWTDGEIYRAITSGVHKNGKALFPIMPYERLRKMTNEDLYSIIAYIRTLDSKEGSYPEKQLDFPLNFIVNTIPSVANAPATAPDTTDHVAYGGYLVNAASCIHCHTKEEKGELVAGTEYGGGQLVKLENGQTLYSANITPDPRSGIGSWSREFFIDRFKRYQDSSYPYTKMTPGGTNTIMPWMTFAGMTRDDLGAIYDYLRTIQPINNQVPKTAHP
jgi:mono/diheme cytochrome c family protein